MAKSIALAADASRLASLLLSYISAVCAFVAPRQPGASTAIIDRLSHSRALSRRASRQDLALVGSTSAEQQLESGHGKSTLRAAGDHQEPRRRYEQDRSARQ